MALTDLTRISTSGIATGSTIDSPILRKDVDFRGDQVGVGSALFDSSERRLDFKDNVKLRFGDSGDLSLYATGSNSTIAHNGDGNLIISTADGEKIYIDSSEIAVRNAASTETLIKATPGIDGGVELYDGADNKRFETTSTGAIVTGILTATGHFSGSTHNTAGLSTFYNLRVSNDLTVEGTTTTIDTNLIGVDRVEVGANSNTTVAVSVAQTGTADIINLFDGTTEVLTVIDGGKVGIGTVTPGFKLDVDYTNNAEDGIRILNRASGSSSTSMLRLGNDENINAAFLMLNSSGYGSVGGAYNLVLGHGLSRDIVFATGGAERLRIDSSGRLRVASTTESADSAFDDLIVGNHSGNRGISILSTNGQQGALGFAKSGTLADGYVAYVHNSTATSSVMTIKSSGLIKFSAGGQERLRMTGNELRFIGGDQNSNEGSKTTKIVYRSLTATVWNTVEIGNISGSNGACSFRMTINCPNSGWSITKIYDIASAYNFTTNNWRVVKPITSTYQYDGDDFEVNIKINTSTTYLRLRKNRSSSSRSGTLQVIMEIYGKGEVFSGTSATGSDSGQLEQYEGTPIGAYSDTSANVGAQMDYNGVQRVKTYNYGALISDDIGSTIPNEFPADNRQLMVYTSTNGQAIGNTACARVLIATDAKQTGAQGYHGSIDFGSSDCSASGGAAEFNWRTAAIMCRGDGDTSPSIADGDLQFWTKTASGTMTHRFDIAPNGDLTATDTNGIGSLSDQRLKTNIQDYTYDLNKFKQLKTRTFDWINPEFHQEGNIRGFIAQEIETVDPYWNYQFEVSKETAKKDYDLLDNGDENYTIRDHRPGKASKLGGKDTMYVSVIQQLMAKIETLEAKVAALES